MKRKVLFFAHVPKCAGTAFFEMLSRNQGARHTRIPNDFFEGPISKSNLSEWLRFNNSKSIYSSHRINLDLPWDHAQVDVYAVTILRDPLARLRSEYEYLKNPGITSSIDINLLGTTFEEFLGNVLDKPSIYYNSANGMTTFLKGPDKETRSSLVRDRRLIMGRLERLDEVCVLLEKMFPDLLHDATVGHLNVNRSKPVSDNLPVELSEKFHAVNEADYKLLDEADRCIDFLKKMLFPEETQFDDSMKAFLRRQSIRNRTIRPIQRLMSKINNRIQRI